MTPDRPRHLLDELAKLENLRDPARTAGLRQFRRFVLRGDAELHPADPTQLDRTPIDVQLRDISRGGVGFVCTRKIPARSNWRMVFLHRGYPIGEQTLCVRHGREITEGVYLVGGQYTIASGLLTMLGIEPGDILDSEGDAPDDVVSASSFLTPGEVA
jgi:hypothetical protein